MAIASTFSSRSWLPAWLRPGSLLTTIHLSGCNRVGMGSRALGRPIVHNAGRIEIGRDTVVRSVGSPVRLVATAAGKISIGDRVFLDVGTSIFSDTEVRIEDGVVVGPNVLICDRDEHGRTGEVVIERGARIGAGAKVIGPCRIGREARVLAGSVVRTDVADGAVAKGRGANGVDSAPPAATREAVTN